MISKFADPALPNFNSETSQHLSNTLTEGSDVPLTLPAFCCPFQDYFEICCYHQIQKELKHLTFNIWYVYVPCIRIYIHFTQHPHVFGLGVVLWIYIFQWCLEITKLKWMGMTFDCSVRSWKNKYIKIDKMIFCWSVCIYMSSPCVCMRWRIFVVSCLAISTSLCMTSPFILSSWPRSISTLELLGTLEPHTFIFYF